MEQKLSKPRTHLGMRVKTPQRIDNNADDLSRCREPLSHSLMAVSVRVGGGRVLVISDGRVGERMADELVWGR